MICQGEKTYASGCRRRRIGKAVSGVSVRLDIDPTLVRVLQHL